MEQCHACVLIFFSPSPLCARGENRARRGSNLAAKAPPARKQIKGWAQVSANVLDADMKVINSWKTSLRDAPCGSITNTEKKGSSKNMEIKIKVNVVTMPFNNGGIEMVSMSLFL